MNELTIEVQPRDLTGTGAAKRLRREGLIPAIVYGGGRDSKPIQIPRRYLLDLLRKSGSEHAVFLLKLGGSGQSRHCMVREMEIDPMTREILHVDFQRVNMKEKVTVEVPVELTGTPVGVKNESGILDFITRHVEVECLPGDIPHHLEVDVSGLHVGQHVEAKDLELPKGVELAIEGERTIASVSAPRLAEEAEEEEEGLLTTAERSEPELVGRRGEEEDED
ncbi:MAG TPA: 50S ribosomal protein L25 [Thermoanaerobaculia bacterium]|nr:50S ribosomal protein L25 [Thermoanaerobaculia bacterium]